jgi:hypothetical protein
VGEDVLITEATAHQLGSGIEAVSCGEHALKGIAEPLALYAPRVGEPVGVRPGEEPLAKRGDGRPDAQPGAGRREAGGLAQL